MHACLSMRASPVDSFAGERLGACLMVSRFGQVSTPTVLASRKTPLKHRTQPVSSIDNGSHFQSS